MRYNTCVGYLRVNKDLKRRMYIVEAVTVARISVAQDLFGEGRATSLSVLGDGSPRPVHCSTAALFVAARP